MGSPKIEDFWGYMLLPKANVTRKKRGRSKPRPYGGIVILI